MSTLSEERDRLRALHAQYEEAIERENGGAIVCGIEDAGDELIAAVPGLLTDVAAAEAEVERLKELLKKIDEIVAAQVAHEDAQETGDCGANHNRAAIIQDDIARARGGV